MYEPPYIDTEHCTVEDWNKYKQWVWYGLMALEAYANETPCK